MGCTIVNNASNSVDGGVACRDLTPDAGGIDRTLPKGTGSLAGVEAFQVRASYQVRRSNVDPKRPDSWLSFALYSESLSCDDFKRSRDAGSNILGDGTRAAAILSGELRYPGRDTFLTGPYAVGRASSGGGFDGGLAWLYLISIAPDAGELMFGTSGVVNVTSVSDCSISGTFDSTFERNDGGTTALSGIFSSVYCE
jgi:hypothetical protein